MARPAAVKAPSSCYIAGDTGSFAYDIGLEPRTTPIESPRSNEMAEAFVRTTARDRVRVSPCPDGETVMQKLLRGSPATTRFTHTKFSDVFGPASFTAGVREYACVSGNRRRASGGQRLVVLGRGT